MAAAATIVAADIEAIHSEVGRGHPYAANNLLDLVRKMFNWGKVAGFVPKDHVNPALGVVRFPERARKRFITTVEMPHFIEGLEAEDKVLSLVAAQLRLGLRRSPLPTEHVLRPDNRVRRYRHYFRRKGLYELVWTAPVMEVAERLGVSDVGLAKLCRRASIPVPGRGYCALVESGQQIGRTPLPAASAGLPGLLRIRGKKPLPVPARSVAA